MLQAPAHETAKCRAYQARWPFPIVSYSRNLRQVVDDLGRLGMLWSQVLLPDAQGSLVERLGLCILALLFVEVRQSIERIGYIGMLRSQLLLPDLQGTLVERLGLGILALL